MELNLVDIYKLQQRKITRTSSETVFFDAYLMLVGYGAMFLYTVFMLGRLTMLELRLFLSLAGILSVFLGLIVSVSVASVLGFPYTTIHAVLPFLCLGSNRITSL